MDQATETGVSPLPISTSEESHVTRHLITLALALVVGGIIVWQLRQPWAKSQIWPWFFLLVAMFYAASALHQMDVWIPGEPILPRLEKISSQMLTILGTLWIAIALALTWLIVRKLLPDYRTLWHGTPQLWLAAMILLLLGAAMLGAVGRGSPRAATASRLWTDSARSRYLEAAAFLLILALAIFL